MKRAGIFFLAGALCVASLSASAQNYTGDYTWLRFWEGTTTSASGIGWYGLWGGPGWTGSGSTPGVSWMADHRDPNADMVEQWYKIAWEDPMTLTGARVEARADQFGQRGTVLGEYKLQYLDSDGVWQNIEVADWNDSTQTPVSLSGTTDFYVQFLGEVTTTAIRVYFPENSYNHDPVAPQHTTLRPGPGLVKFLPIGNLASGAGLDPSNPHFNILATSGNYLGIQPVATYLSGDPIPGLIDGFVSENQPRFGWYSATATFSNAHAFICDFGADAELMIHGVTLYPGTFASYAPTTIDVYVTDDLDDWGTIVGTAARSTEGVIALSGFDKAGRYVILANPTGGVNIYVQELAISASPIPEPATMTLLALGGLAMLRRRK
ncbi:MAG: PEP-CTERM sorting domain-containing protein [Phycisphaerae bacterium]|nr:PEP-CTERM sorting domain-containing protein [Phycisphaerae bacterium]